MNVSALIDAIVRQTTVLIAQLATSDGARAQLSHTANQVFLDLVGALKEQGLSSKVIADMFGLALRTYQERVRRLSESQTMRGQSLWEAVLAHVAAEGPLLRARVLERFRYDDSESVRGVLRDLVNSGLVYRTGRGDAVTYRAADREELRAQASSSREGLLHLLWIAVQQHAPVSAAELQTSTAIDATSIELALTTLLDRGLVTRDSTGKYQSHGCVLPFDQPAGWEGAVFDHYQAMVGAICAKLELGRLARRDDAIGGSTFGFEIWPGHPHEARVRGLLERFRAQASELRAEVAEFNAQHEAPDDKQRVITYLGQNVLSHRARARDEEAPDSEP